MVSMGSDNAVETLGQAFADGLWGVSDATDAHAHWGRGGCGRGATFLGGTRIALAFVPIGRQSLAERVK